MNDLLNDYRCECGKLLLRGLVLTGEVEIKCKYCKLVKTILGIQSVNDSERCMLILATDGSILKASRSAEYVLGYQHEELLQRNISDVLVPSPDGFLDELCELLDKKGNTVIFLQSFIRQKTGEMVPTQISVSRFGPSDKPHILFNIERKTARNRSLFFEKKPFVGDSGKKKVFS